MPLINCEINLVPTLPKNCIISNASGNQNTTFAITDAKLYVPVVAFSAQYNPKLLQELKSGFKCTINWNKYESKSTTQNAPNKYLDFLNDPRFQGVNRLFLLACKAIDSRKGHSNYYLPTSKF